MLCVGVDVATSGNASEILATCVNIGGMIRFFTKTKVDVGLNGLQPATINDRDRDE
jgi:hypothetical protein